MATLQASLLSKPSLPFPFPSPSIERVRHSTFSLRNLSFTPFLYLSNLHLTRLTPRVPSTRFCTFRLNSLPKPNPSPSEQPDFGSSKNEPDVNSVERESVNSTEEIAVSVSDSKESKFEVIGNQDSETVLQGGVAELELVGEEVAKPKSERKSVNLGEKKKVVGVNRLSIVVFFVGLWARVRESVKRAFSDFFDWWPFWRQEKRLARLIAEADANPQDAAKQSALFVELNKHRFGILMLKRFRNRTCMYVCLDIQ